VSFAAGNRLIVPLDVATADEADALLARLGGVPSWIKVGLELFCAEGPAIVARYAARGLRVMLDLKLHDIPATVAGGMRAAARAGAELVTVHALGGPAMLAAAVEGAGDRCRVAAVTILTSAGPAQLAAAGLLPAAEAVPRLAALAVAAGCRAVVCSPLEAGILRALLGPAVELICPGVRPGPTPAGDDQARVATPAEAILAGATRIVVGRPITRSADVQAAARAVRDQAVAAAAGR
jgi:orotidine-5'-phosphate decarboxylase